MLTWGSLFWSLYHDHMGPRCCAVLGMLLATAGNVLVAAAVSANSKDEYEYTLGLGLMAAGGNGAFISSFQFTALFDANQGIRVSILSAGAHGDCGESAQYVHGEDFTDWRVSKTDNRE
eukprot:6212518-Pleurochrysis_carterae.AAC.20